MEKKANNILCEGGESKICEILIEDNLAIPASVTFETAEPPFEKVSFLYSDKPLRFTKPILSS